MGKMVLLALVALTMWGGRALRLSSHHAYTEARSYEDVYYLPPPSWLPVLSLGYRAALADLLWARTLVYFGDEMKHKGEVRHVYHYADAILALDDHFRAAYRWVGTAALYRPTEITVEDARRATGYLERAVKLWPDDGELAWELGATLRFELVPLLKQAGDTDAVREATLRGSEYIQTAARLGAGPPWLAVTAATGFEQAGRTERAIQHLEEVYQSVRDPATKRRIEERLRRLRSESYVSAMRRAVKRFERERKADYPYLSPGLFLVLGPKPGDTWAEAVARGFRPPPTASPGEPVTSPDEAGPAGASDSAEP